MERLCPDEEMLADYLEGRLSDDEKSRLEKHVSQCDQCLEDMMISKNLVNETYQFELDQVPDRVTKGVLHMLEDHGGQSWHAISIKLKRFFNNLSSSLSDYLGPIPWGRFALAPIRGTKTVVSDDLVQLRKTFKEIEADIEIEKKGPDSAHIRVRLTDRKKNEQGIRVTLRKGEREFASYLPGKSGYVFFEDIPFGQYSLDFDKDGAKLGTYPFIIKESHHGRK